MRFVSGREETKVNNHPHSEWLDFALKGRNKKGRGLLPALPFSKTL